MAPGSTSIRPTVATEPSNRSRRVANAKHGCCGLHQCVVAAVHRSRSRMPGAAFERRAARARNRRSPSRFPAAPPPRRATGPCSMWSSRNAVGTSSLRQSARLPMQPTSSPRNATTEPQPASSTASIAATTPSAPSNIPPCGTESRWEPTQTSSRLSERPSRLPCASVSTASPASRSQPAVSSCAVSSSALGCGRFAPGPPPIAYSSSRRPNTRSTRALT